MWVSERLVEIIPPLIARAISLTEVSGKAKLRGEGIKTERCMSSAGKIKATDNGIGSPQKVPNAFSAEL
jgi:hypothetical protein